MEGSGCGFFLLFTTVAAIFVVLSIIWIVRSFIGFKWSYMPYPSHLLEHFEALLEYDRQYGFDQGGPDQTFEDQLRRSLIQAATDNTYNNNSRSELIYAATRFLVIAVGSTLLAGVPIIVSTISRHLLESVI